MQQLAGNINRPGQLGNTGQIILQKCNMGKCECNKPKEPKPQRGTNKLQQQPTNPIRRPPVVKSNPGLLSTRPTIRRPFFNPRTRIPSLDRTKKPEETREVNFTDGSGKVRVGIVTGTSVSSSVTSSSSVSGVNTESLKPAGSFSPAELLRQRMRIVQQNRRRFY
jgi:hypothetical protein